VSDFLLAIDVGTTNCRVSIFEPGRGLRAQAAGGCAVTTDASGAAEQDAAAVWNLARGLLRQAVGQSGARSVRAVSLSVQGDAIIPADGNGDPIHPAILGMDYRSAPQTRRLEKAAGSYRIFRRTGMRPHPLNSLCKIMWLKEVKPEVFSRTRRIFTYADFFLAKLGAEPALDDTMASRSMGCDIANGDWSAWILDHVGIERGLLSPVVRAGTQVGRMSKALADDAGLDGQPLLVAGAHDQVCAALGAGLPLRAQSVISTGTAEVLSTVLQEPILTRAFYEAHYPCYRYAVPGSWFTFSLNHAGGILLTWFAELVQGGAAGVDALLAVLPDGPSPVMVLPHFKGSGTPTCDLRSRGAIVGLTLDTRPADIALAILESLAFELRINRDRLESAGVRLGEMAVVGGGARSDAWLQVKADVLGCPLHKPDVEDAAALGAAILAGVGSGLFAGVEEGIRAMVPPSRTIDPRPARAAAYTERFGLYTDLYPALLPTHRRLSCP
jgi:xylulokinase